MLLSRLHAIFLWSTFFMMGSQAFVKPCIYQADKCGFTLISTYGYNLSELILAVNQTPSIPPLTAGQLPQVVFHCEDIYGTLIGNSFCVNGCLASLSLTQDDECRLSPGETCPPATSTVTVTVPPATPTPTCFKQCQTWCFGTTFAGMNTILHPVPTPGWI